MKRTRGSQAAASSSPNTTAAAQETVRRRRKPLPKASSRGAKPPPASAAADGDGVARCAWATMYKGAASAEYIAYHDTEWGVPEHDDNKLFELLVLEGAQVGQGWWWGGDNKQHSKDFCCAVCVVKLAMFQRCCPAATACLNRRARGGLGRQAAQQAFCAAHGTRCHAPHACAPAYLSAGGTELVDRPVCVA